MKPRQWRLHRITVKVNGLVWLSAPIGTLYAQNLLSGKASGRENETVIDLPILPERIGPISPAMNKTKPAPRAAKRSAQPKPPPAPKLSTQSNPHGMPPREIGFH